MRGGALDVAPRPGPREGVVDARTPHQPLAGSDAPSGARVQAELAAERLQRPADARRAHLRQADRYREKVHATAPARERASPPLPPSPQAATRGFYPWEPDANPDWSTDADQWTQREGPGAAERTPGGLAAKAPIAGDADAPIRDRRFPPPCRAEPAVWLD